MDVDVAEIEAKAKFTKHAQYSENAASILKLASNKAAIESKGIVGTEDILWALFAASQDSSRSKAVMQLSERGISFDMIFGRVVLSENARVAFQQAIQHAQDQNHGVVGSEDLLWALFQKTKKDSRARNWLNSARRGILLNSESLQLRRTLSVQKPAKQQIETSVSQLFVIGGIAGMVETFVQQPLIYWKTMSQINANFNVTHALRAGIRPLFRGVGVNAGSIGPISAVQLAAHGSLESLARKFSSQETIESTWMQLSVASAAGVMSCVVVSPAEVLMVTQQATGRSLVNACKDLVGTSGIKSLFRGNVATAFREAAWTCGFFGATPVIKSGLQNDSKFFRRNEVAASAVASVISGQCAALVSQPTDVVASMMKADGGLDGQKIKYPTFTSACKSLYAESGVKGFFRGLTSRSIRLCGAVFIMGETQDMLQSALNN